MDMEIDGNALSPTIDGIPENRMNSSDTFENEASGSNRNENTSDNISILNNNKNDVVNAAHQNNDVQRLECSGVDKGGDESQSDFSKLLASNDSVIGYVDDDDLEANELGATGIDRNIEIPSDTHEIEIGTYKHFPF